MTCSGKQMLGVGGATDFDAPPQVTLTSIYPYLPLGMDAYAVENAPTTAAWNLAAAAVCVD